jgi:hypothetical protein
MITLFRKQADHILDHNEELRSQSKLSGYSKLLKLVDFKYNKLVLKDTHPI